MPDTTFDPWLRALAAAGKGPVTLREERTRKLEAAFILAGDWTGATLRGAVRLSPDAAGAVLASFAVTGPVVASGVSTFTVSLAAGSGANSTGSLPADGEGGGVARFAYDLLITPLGDDEEVLVGGVLEILGRVTA